jgi:hypothetical protein
LAQGQQGQHDGFAAPADLAATDSRRRYFTKAACHIISMATAGHPASRVRAR